MKRQSLFLLLLLFLIPLNTSAQLSFPERQDFYVNDYADLLAFEDEANLRDGLSQFQAETGIEITILTIFSVDDFNQGATIERFATDLFNNWQIGDAVSNDGVLLLVAIEDRELRIEVGAGYGTSMNEAGDRIIDRTILPYFRDGDFDRGIIAGVNELMAVTAPEASVSGNQFSAEAPPISSPTVEERRDDFAGAIGSTFSRFWGVFIVGGLSALIFGIFSLRNWRRSRERDCPVCGQQLHRLSEEQDDVYLTSGQRLEEVLGSIDYDVWKCDNCNHHDILPYEKWFSGYHDCPNCAYKTLFSYTTTIRRATTYSTGLKEIVRDCEHCEYRDTETAVIPMISDSNSGSSSSSFSGGGSSGGGFSSGGGSSGSW